MHNHPPDHVLINNTKPRLEIEEAYREDDVYLILPTSYEVEKIKKIGCVPIVADLLEEDWAGKRKLHKLDTIRHDPRKVRGVLMDIYKEKVSIYP
jgi:hypothetical protein